MAIFYRNSYAMLLKAAYFNVFRFILPCKTKKRIKRASFDPSFVSI